MINKFVNIDSDKKDIPFKVVNVEILSLDMLKEQQKGVERVENKYMAKKIIRFETLAKYPDLSPWTLIIWSDDTLEESYLCIVQADIILVKSVIE